MTLKLINVPNTDIQTVKEAAAKVFVGYPHVINLTIVQAILEADLDHTQSKTTSSLAIKYNNLFGIKWPTTKSVQERAKKHGKPVSMNTKEEIKGKKVKVNDQFIHFNSLEDCLEYRKYMLSWDRYKKVYKAKNLKGAAETMKAGGYATDSKYVQGLIARAKKHDIK